MKTPKSKALNKMKRTVSNYKNNQRDDVKSGAALGHPLYTIK